MAHGSVALSASRMTYDLTTTHDIDELDGSIPRSAAHHAAQHNAEFSFDANASAWPTSARGRSESVCSADSSSRSSPDYRTRIPVRRKSNAPIPAKHLQRVQPLSRSPDQKVPSETVIAPKGDVAQLYDEDGFLIQDADERPSPPVQRQPRRHVTAPVTASKLVCSQSVPLDLVNATSSIPAQSEIATNNPDSSSPRDCPRRACSIDRLAARANRSVSDTPQDRQRRLHAINTAPQGPPPWLSKFQPDPTLPSDQQLLPTVAKKLARERASKESGIDVLVDSFGVPLTALKETSDRDSSLTNAPTLTAPQMETKVLEMAESSMVRPKTSSSIAVQNRAAPVRNFSRRAVASSLAPQGSRHADKDHVDKPIQVPMQSPREPTFVAVTYGRSGPSVDHGHSSSLDSRKAVPPSNDCERKKSVGCCVVM